MSKGTKGGYSPDKSRNKTIAQVSILVICFVMIAALTIMFSNFSKKKGEDYQNPELVQRKVPSDDATVAVFETTKGTFKAVLYEEQAPEACKYFKDLVKTGYYDGTYVFGVQKDVYFLGGSKAKDGTRPLDWSPGHPPPGKTVRHGSRQRFPVPPGARMNYESIPFWSSFSSVRAEEMSQKGNSHGNVHYFILSGDAVSHSSREWY